MKAKRVILLCAALFWMCGLGVAQGASSNEAVAWVLFSKGSGLPEAVSFLSAGDAVVLKKGERMDVAILANATRRVFRGPVSLKVTRNSISIRSGRAAQVFPLPAQFGVLTRRWLARYGSGENWMPSPLQAHNPAFEVVSPVQDSLLLNTRPEFVFEGTLPRDGKLIIYDEEGKRFWVQPLDSAHVTFPPAADFEWGKAYTWEIRRLTGGSVLAGSFRIAHQKVAADLLRAMPFARIPVPAHGVFFEAARLHLVGAYREARDLWHTMGAVNAGLAAGSRK